MAKIYAPNKQYTGISAGVPFAAGVGESNSPARLAWFREHGYEVAEEATAPAPEPPAITVEPEKSAEPDSGKKAAK